MGYNGYNRVKVVINYSIDYYLVDMYAAEDPPLTKIETEHIDTHNWIVLSTLEPGRLLYCKDCSSEIDETYDHDNEPFANYNIGKTGTLKCFSPNDLVVKDIIT
jgi:hypothetical protein